MNNTQSNPVRTVLVGLRFGASLANRKIFGTTENDAFIKIVGVCDRDHEKADAYAAQHGNLPVYYDLEDVLKVDDVEAIMLMIPPAGRAEAVRKCLQAGKHVLTTKPFESDPDAALKVLREAREMGLAVHMNSPAPLPSDDLAQIQAWHKKFDLGKPISAHWETYAPYKEVADGSWFDSYEKCPAAPIFRLGIYGINELIAVLGEAEEVELFTSRMTNQRLTPDNAQLMIKFANGAIGSIYAALCVGDGQYYPAGLTLHYERGTIYKRQVRKFEDKIFTHLEMRVTTTKDGKFYEETATLPAVNRSGEYQLENFYNAVRNGISENETSPEAIASGIKVINMMAAKEKRI